MQNVDELKVFDKSNITDVIHINSIPEYCDEEYNLYDKKEFKKYIQDIEKIVRSSFEYQRMIQFCREYMNMNECAFYKNINNIDTTSIRIELHHSPLQLVDITRIVYKKRCYYDQPLDVDSVAEEITMLHYCGLIGLIPLSETVHELVHNNYLFIPTTSVLGRYQDFIQIYGLWMDDYTEFLDKIERYTLLYDNSRSNDLLSRKYMHLDVSGAYMLPKMQDIYELVENKINSIKQGIPMM